jgi:hypothetical protein
LFGKQALGCKNNVAKLKSFVYFLQFHQLQLIGLICTKAKSDFKDLLKSMGADGFPACWIIRFFRDFWAQRPSFFAALPTALNIRPTLFSTPYYQSVLICARCEKVYRPLPTFVACG